MEGFSRAILQQRLPRVPLASLSCGYGQTHGGWSSSTTLILCTASTLLGLVPYPTNAEHLFSVVLHPLNFSVVCSHFFITISGGKSTIVVVDLEPMLLFSPFQLFCDSPLSLQICLLSPITSGMPCWTVQIRGISAVICHFVRTNCKVYF